MSTMLVRQRAKPMSVFPRSRFSGLALSMISLCILAVAVSAGASQNPTPGVVSSGGTVSAQSATHRVSGSVGQVSSARVQSPTHKVAEGFWNTLEFCDCPFIGDLNTDYFLDVFDVVLMVNVAFRNSPTPPSDPQCPLISRADLNCDDIVDILDVVRIVGVAFRNDDSRCDPCAN